MHNTIQGGDFKRQDKLLEDLIEAGHAPGEIVSALMHLLAGESSRSPERIPEDDPRQQRRPPRERSFDDRAPRPQRDEGRSYDERPHGKPREMTSRSFDVGPAPRIDETGIWLKFNVGENAGAAPGDFVGCIANEAQVPRTVIGGIRILATVSFVQVAAEFAEHIMASVQGVRLRNRTIQVMPGMPPRRDFNATGEGPRRPPRG